MCHPCLSAVVANDSLDDVVVTATRNPQPVTEALEPVVLIDRATLENSLANDVGDVLRYHAGLDSEVRLSLDDLKDTLFRLELRRQAGTISEDDYARERARMEGVLRSLVRG